MTLMEKHSNVNRIFESNKFASGQQELTNSSIEATITPCSKVKILGKQKSSLQEDRESRRSSGNSIQIKVTNANEDEPLDSTITNNYSVVNEAERENLNDIEVEDTSSNELDNFEQTKKKSLKERKKLVRSSIQQKHHLTYQESTEDQPEEAKQLFRSQNTAFDELFAAANTGNFIQSAHVEAKMAIAAGQKVVDEQFASEDLDKSVSRTSSFRRGFRNSFKSRNSPIKSTENSPPGSNKLLPKPSDNKLGAPQQLTRSQSCKRPGSFKRSQKAKQNGLVEANRKESPTSAQPAHLSGRRGTQGSINLGEMEGRCGSLPMDNMNGEEDTEICRVRQFNITNKGIVNRGDSFKRSFKRSNNSLTSKKEISPTINHADSNTLNLPDTYDGFFVNKSCNNSNHGLNDASSNAESKSTQSGVIDNKSISSRNVNFNTKKEPVAQKSYLVYMIGASSVGKNALIKQFQTSEYRGTYDVYNQTRDVKNDGVVIALDGIESLLTFVSMDIDMLKLSTSSLFQITKDNDAFIVVYSISDKTSFNIAIDLLKSIRLSENKNQPVILVGNKSDLVRKRSISREDAGIIAMKFGCKFVETSVAINDKVDDLLAGVLKQIRLHEGIDKDSVSNGSGKINMRRSRKQSEHNESNDNQFITRNKFLSFRSNTLSRKFFRPKTNESPSPKEFSTQNSYSDIEKGNKFAKINFSDQQSFFHKVFNNIFKRRSDLSHLGSVENLFTPPNMN